MLHFTTAECNIGELAYRASVFLSYFAPDTSILEKEMAKRVFVFFIILLLAAFTSHASVAPQWVVDQRISIESISQALQPLPQAATHAWPAMALIAARRSS